ncbi:MAG TPA: hypothetical protein PKK69_04985 [Ferruginibacter sp.]|nr:hypothetical protein [Ferruginibacter sp.]
METRESILNETRELSPLLAELSKTPVFQVPEGYFEALSASTLLKINHQNQQQAPAASVPEGYFDALPGLIMNRIKAESATSETPEILEGLSHQPVFRVPNGYFESLPDQVMARIQSANTETILPAVLQGLSDKPSFRVPAGYFESLPDQVMSRINEAKPAKVISMGSRVSFFRYAVAAAFTGLIGLSLFNLGGASNNEEVAAELSPAVMAQAKQIIQNKSFDATLETISDDEITHFLQDNGQDVNSALVASLTTDDASLPDADEYLINDETLDQLLNKLETQQTNN